jgi:hypothetical protein
MQKKLNPHRVEPALLVKALVRVGAKEVALRLRGVATAAVGRGCGCATVAVQSRQRLQAQQEWVEGHSQRSRSSTHPQRRPGVAGAAGQVVEDEEAGQAGEASPPSIVVGSVQCTRHAGEALATSRPLPGPKKYLAPRNGPETGKTAPAPGWRAVAPGGTCQSTRGMS